MKLGRFFYFVLVAMLGSMLIYSQVIVIHESTSNSLFYFGVSFGQVTAEKAKILIDKVKSFTNFFLINSYDLTTNQTQLDEVCDYAAQADLKFVVYFDFISRIRYPWHQQWLDTARDRWEGKFLGVYLRDEPGGRQIDTQEFFTNASDYDDAANRFINNITSTSSTIDAKNKSIALFTSDYALYWWDYLAGYDTVFAELGWNLNSTQQISLCRGASNMQGKNWGAIIVWKYYDPPYLASAKEVYDDMVLAYRGGAKYVVVFNHPTYPESNPYGILSQEHFEAMEQFWNYVKTYPRSIYGDIDGEVALVLPDNYGWAMRRTENITMDKIWGLWPEDEKSALILDSCNKMLVKHGLRLDIIYDNHRFDYKSKYSKIQFWNSTLT